MKNWGAEGWSAVSLYSFIAMNLWIATSSEFKSPALSWIALALIILFVYAILRFVEAKNKEIKELWTQIDELRHEAEAKYQKAEAKYQKKIEVIKALQAKCDRLESAKD